MTSLLLDFNGFANSVVMELVCILFLPGSHFQKERDTTACGVEAPLPPSVLRDIPDETVKAVVDCLVVIIVLATATTAVLMLYKCYDGSLRQVGFVRARRTMFHCLLRHSVRAL